ncbi:hypothetical protein CEXT_40371 [Caerostris extrusa]|uniref:Uncharacterized protein n=1 Tax=Caerostris extrusa TaxID=172846 RepID=A0AAV4Y7Q1_CAEEX|nr:hypothetical protein CEXT_40371 [Caerostris extrusa]
MVRIHFNRHLHLPKKAIKNNHRLLTKEHPRDINYDKANISFIRRHPCLHRSTIPPFQMTSCHKIFKSKKITLGGIGSHTGTSYSPITSNNRTEKQVGRGGEENSFLTAFEPASTPTLIRRREAQPVEGWHSKKT